MIKIAAPASSSRRKEPVSVLKRSEDPGANSVGGRSSILRRWTITIVTILALTDSALAGPPYISDDPQPTDYKHFEIYTFSSGTATREGVRGAAGIDFTYGAAPDVQLTATLPVGFDSPSLRGTSVGPSNVELAAKYRFLHQ